jgi:hypothetical protein
MFFPRFEMPISTGSLNNDRPIGQFAQERTWILRERMECEAIDGDESDLVLDVSGRSDGQRESERESAWGTHIEENRSNDQ